MIASYRIRKLDTPSNRNGFQENETLSLRDLFQTINQTNKQNNTNKQTIETKKSKTTELHSIANDQLKQPYKQQLHFFSTLHFN